MTTGQVWSGQPHKDLAWGDAEGRTGVLLAQGDEVQRGHQNKEKSVPKQQIYYKQDPVAPVFLRKTQLGQESYLSLRRLVQLG